MNPTPYMSAKDSAKYMGLSTYKFRLWRRAARLKPAKMGKSTIRQYYAKKDLDRHLEGESS